MLGYIQTLNTKQNWQAYSQERRGRLPPPSLSPCCSARKCGRKGCQKAASEPLASPQPEAWQARSNPGATQLSRARPGSAVGAFTDFIGGLAS